jgi:phage gp46-like protein
MPIDALMARSDDDGTWDFQKSATNDVLTTSTAHHAVLTQLLEHRGSDGIPGWIWDSTPGSGTPDTHGSLLYLVDSDTPEQRSRFAAWALEALDVLVKERRITSPTCEIAPQVVVGRIDAVIRWLDHDGRPAEPLPVSLGVA